jgi:hypothetical protein
MFWPEIGLKSLRVLPLEPFHKSLMFNGKFQRPGASKARSLGNCQKNWLIFKIRRYSGAIRQNSPTTP